MLQRIKRLSVAALILALIAGAILSTKNNVFIKMSKQMNTQAMTQTDIAIPLNLLMCVQSISISDDSDAGHYWIPTNQKAILSQLVSWLKSAIPYSGKVPKSENMVFFANIGPSILHIKSDKHYIMIYPAWYIKSVGQKVNAHSMVYYVQGVVAFEVVTPKTEHQIIFLECQPLYNWLKTNEWKKEFVQK